MTVSRLGPGGYPKEPYGAFSGKPVALVLAITETINKLQLPINCVLAGQQPDEKNTPKFITDMHGILKKIIFGE